MIEHTPITSNYQLDPDTAALIEEGRKIREQGGDEYVRAMREEMAEDAQGVDGPKGSGHNALTDEEQRDINRLGALSAKRANADASKRAHEKKPQKVGPEIDRKADLEEWTRRVASGGVAAFARERASRRKRQA